MRLLIWESTLKNIRKKESVKNQAHIEPPVYTYSYFHDQARHGYVSSILERVYPSSAGPFGTQIDPSCILSSLRKVYKTLCFRLLLVGLPGNIETFKQNMMFLADEKRAQNGTMFRMGQGVSFRYCSGRRHC